MLETTQTKQNRWLRIWRAANPDKVKEYQREAYKRKRDHLLEYQKQYRTKNRDTIRVKSRGRWNSVTPEEAEQRKQQRRRSTMLRRYGIIPEQYAVLLQRQEGHCALCQRTGGQERYGLLCIDHCHDTGAVRGLLCTPCNHTIGILGDDASGLRSALEYVERTNNA